MALALLALLSADLVIPAGTRIPIRFVQRITSGRDTVGTQVLVQTMGALMQDSCVLIPPYVRAKGRIVVSRAGRADPTGRHLERPTSHPSRGQRGGTGTTNPA